MFILDAIRSYFKKKGEENKRGLRKFVLTAPLIVILVALVLLGIGIIRSVAISNDRYDTRMNTVWAQDSETNYRHIAVYAGGNRPNGMSGPQTYLDASHSLKMSDITAIRTSLQSAVDTGSTNPGDNGLNRDGSPRNWEDCWSTTLQGEASIEKPGYTNRVTSSCEIVGVGGNFKVFHPFMYMAGGFLPETCVDLKQIVVNDVLAWKFFSSYDVVGYTITLWDEEYVISGVVSEPGSKIDRTVGTNEPRVYMYYNNIASVFSSDDGTDISIMCYEAMLPEAVSGVAITDMKTALPVYSAEDPQMDVVSVTGRMFFTKVWDYVMPIGSVKGIEQFNYPYWEKASRAAVSHLFADMVLIALGALLLIIGIVMMVLKLKDFKSANDSEATNEEQSIS